MKNDADFNDACCQRAAVTPRLAPRQLGGQDENRQETEKTCLLFRADLFAFALLRRQQKEKQKIQFKIIAALCLLLVARQQHVPPLLPLPLLLLQLRPQKHVDYFKRHQEKWPREEDDNLLPATCPKFLYSSREWQPKSLISHLAFGSFAFYCQINPI